MVITINCCLIYRHQNNGTSKAIVAEHHTKRAREPGTRNTKLYYIGNLACIGDTASISENKVKAIIAADVTHSSLLDKIMTFGSNTDLRHVMFSVQV